MNTNSINGFFPRTNSKSKLNIGTLISILEGGCNGAIKDVDRGGATVFGISSAHHPLTYNALIDYSYYNNLKKLSLEDDNVFEFVSNFYKSYYVDETELSGIANPNDMWCFLALKLWGSPYDIFITILKTICQKYQLGGNVIDVLNDSVTGNQLRSIYSSQYHTLFKQKCKKLFIKLGYQSIINGLLNRCDRSLARWPIYSNDLTVKLIRSLKD